MDGKLTLWKGYGCSEGWRLDLVKNSRELSGIDLVAAVEVEHKLIKLTLGGGSNGQETSCRLGKHAVSELRPSPD